MPRSGPRRMNPQSLHAAWLAVFGPLPTLNVRFAGEVWRGKGTSGHAASLHWGGLRFDQTSLRCSASWPRRRTHFAHCVRCIQASATSQLTTRASREAARPGLAGRAGPVGPAVRKAQAVPRTACPRAHLLGAPEALRVLPERAFAEALALIEARTPTGAARQLHKSGCKRTAATGRQRPLGTGKVLFPAGRRGAPWGH